MAWVLAASEANEWPGVVIVLAVLAFGAFFVWVMGR